MTLFVARPRSRMSKLVPAALTTLPLAVLACMAHPALADTITLSSPTCGPSDLGGAGTCSATVTNGAVSSLGATLTSPFTSVAFSSATDLVLDVTANANGQLSTAQPSRWRTTSPSIASASAEIR